ncbi:MAG: DUF3047 domain-containing protein [Burkholderiales bacterium]
MMPRRRFLAAAAAAMLHPRAALAQVLAPVHAMRFSALQAGAPLPAELKPYAFENQPRHTQYALVADAGRTVLHARAEASTSGLTRELRVDPAAHPLLAWSWKAMRLVDKGDLATKDGDDFAVRLYVTFDLDTSLLSAADRMKVGLARMIYGDRVPVAALCYVWDARAPVGTFAPNAYTDRVRMVVVDSGPEKLGAWVSHQRDVAADFRRAFSLEPPAVNAVIIASDTDNTGESAEAYYGDVSFRPRLPS